MRGRSYTPSPPRGYGRRGRSPPRGGRHGRGDAPTSLLVRNLRHDCRPEDLRRPFGQFGPLKDIYLPRDYYSGEPRGFGFVQYVDPDDAAEAKYQMDGQVLQGRELTVVFAEENRKKPNEMRSREPGRGRAYDQRRSPPRYSRSPPPRNGRSRSRDYYSPSKRRYSRAVSPHGDRGRERSYSRSPVRERSPPHDGRRYSREKSYSRSPAREQSPPYDGQRNRGGSPLMYRSPGRGRSHSRSRSPYPPEYSRGEMGRDRSPSH